MKHQEFYSKYKTNYPPVENPMFSKRTWWHSALIIVAAVLIEPLILYKNQRSVPFSLHYYLLVTSYCLAISVPLVVLLLWLNWRESTKRMRGYVWVGKFEVIDKHLSFLLQYLVLSPGRDNKIRVDRGLFEKTRVGDIMLIRRDALGKIEDIRRINNFSNRLTKAGLMQFRHRKRGRSKGFKAPRD